MNNNRAALAELVRDVYINPIRSLLAIDDEFPTLDEFLDEHLTDGASKKKEADTLREIIKFARHREIPWLVDVHDGKDISGNQEKKIAPRLNASDLMILDYKLKGEELGGSTAIDILRGLAANDHFNLVLLYTKGENGNVIDVLYEIALGLCKENTTFKLIEAERQAVINALENWQANFAQEGSSEKLLEEFTSQLYLKSFERRGESLKWILDTEDGMPLKERLANVARYGEISQDLLLKWLFENRQQRVSSQLCDVDLGQIRIGADEHCCWISCEKLFITLLSKRCAPKEFESKIIDAIVASHPTPHRLLLTKMRASIEQRGLVAEIDILRDAYVQTAWLSDFLNPNPKDEVSAIVGTVTRHWEAMGDELRSELVEFGTTLRTQYHGVELEEVMKRSGLRFVNPNSYETLQRYNSFVSTKQFDRGHLTTGHVFSFRHEGVKENQSSDAVDLPENLGKQSGELEYWMCLSPACDMVPGQKDKTGNTNRADVNDDFLSFTAVRLHAIKSETAIGKATENLCIFLKLADSIKAFSILTDADAKGSPIWEKMIARNSGLFCAKTKLLNIARVTTFGGHLKIYEIEATLIAQLRSDYATNLLQKFGTQLTRPGLGMQFKGRT